MTNHLPDSEQKRDSARITHYMLPNRSLIPIDGYLIPERTWVVIRDALQTGSWGEWEDWINEQNSHPDLPSLSELRSSLLRAGLKEPTIRDLVLLAVVMRERVYREVHDNLHADEMPTDFEPLNIQPVKSLLDIVDSSFIISAEVEISQDDEDEIDQDDDIWIDSDEEDEQDEEINDRNSTQAESGFRHIPSRFQKMRPEPAPDKFTDEGEESHSSGYTFLREQARLSASSRFENLGRFGDKSSSEYKHRLELLRLEQTNLKQLLLILIAINLVMFAAIAALTARSF
jgi:hypothetical protein